MTLNRPSKTVSWQDDLSRSHATLTAQADAKRFDWRRRAIRHSYKGSCVLLDELWTHHTLQMEVQICGAGDPSFRSMYLEVSKSLPPTRCVEISTEC